MEDLIPLVAVLAPFTMVVLIIVLPAMFRSRERQEMQQTVRHAIDKGQELPPELVEAIAKSSAKRPATAHTDLRTGVIWLAVAAGLATFGWAIGYQADEAVGPIFGIAAIPGFIGLAFILLSFFNKTKAD